MLNDIAIRDHRTNKRKGLVLSVIIHSILLTFLLLPLMTYPDPPLEAEGILVSFGAPDMGDGDSRPDTQQDEMVDPKPPSEETVRETVVRPAEPLPTPPSTAPKEVITAEDPEVISLRKREEERKRQEEQDKIERERQRVVEERRVAEQAERDRQAEEARKKAELEKAKKQFGDAFGGTGKGKTGKPGNQGDPGGDPDAKNLEGISTGTGTIGGGLKGRGVVTKPTISDRSQKTGIVVIRICVDKNGNVTEARYTQDGSTSADSELRRIAEESARKFQFSPGAADKQCGTVTIEFKVR